MSVPKTIARAWAEPEFKARLMTDPKTALAEMGVQVPEGVSVTVSENNRGEWHLVLPPKPEGELSQQDLEKVAAAVRDLTSALPDGIREF